MGVLVETTGAREVMSSFYDHDPARCLAAGISAGGVRHAFTGGAFINLFRRRVIGNIRGFACVSGGIGTAVNFLGGGKPPSTRIFSDCMSGRRLFNPWRRLWGRPPYDVDYVDRVFTGEIGEWPFNYEAAVAHPAPIYAVLGCPETGEPLVYELKTAEDARLLSAYGTAVTGLSRPVEFKGRPVTDGFFTGHGFPVKLLCEKVNPTDILIFAGSHRFEDPSRTDFLEGLAYGSGFARTNSRVRELIRTRNVRFMEGVEEAIAMGQPRVLVIWMPEKLSQLRIPRKKSRELIRIGYQTMDRLFAECGH